jgi:hypothetical protein
MTRNVHLFFTPTVYQAVTAHLFRGDRREHAGALLCGWVQNGKRVLLVAREFVPARDGVDYTTTRDGHGRLQPLFIDDVLTRAKEQGLAYIGLHNHFSDDQVAFSKVDFASHAYGYPTLARLNAGLPVGAAVFGLNSIEVDLWMPGGGRHQLKTARVIGNGVRHLWASTSMAPASTYDERFDRQLPFLRAAGQGLVAATTIAIVGVGGLGSQLLEPLVRLGFRHFILIDPDRIDRSNYSRVHGSRLSDLPRILRRGTAKVKIAARLLSQIAPDVVIERVQADIAKGEVYKHLLNADFVFLAADTAEARLTCNAVAQQYFIPMLQLGTKVQIAPDKSLQGVFGAIRHIRPGTGCLWCNGLIDRVALANAGKPEVQRRVERYGVTAPNPAVVTFNAEVAARGMNEFLLSYICGGLNRDASDYGLIDLLSGEREPLEPTHDPECPFCSQAPGSHFGVAVARPVPVVGN